MLRFLKKHIRPSYVNNIQNYLYKVKIETSCIYVDNNPSRKNKRKRNGVNALNYWKTLWQISPYMISIS